VSLRDDEVLNEVARGGGGNGLGLQGAGIVAADSKGLGPRRLQRHSRAKGRMWRCARTDGAREETAGTNSESYWPRSVQRALDVTDSKAVSDFVAAQKRLRPHRYMRYQFMGGAV